MNHLIGEFMISSQSITYDSFYILNLEWNLNEGCPDDRDKWIYILVAIFRSLECMINLQMGGKINFVIL